MMRIIGLLLVGLVACAAAQEPIPTTKPSLPDPHCHEFNSKIPTEFTGMMIDLETAAKQKFSVYASGEKTSKKQIILIHEWWGLNSHIKGMADQLGKLGYRTYAVDLYGGKTTDKAEEAAKLMEAAMKTPEACREKLKAAVAHAVKENANAKRGTVGWCFGGGWSLQTALAGGKDVHACVIYYGQLESDGAKLSNLSAPVLGIFATKDGWITPAMVTGFEKAMRDAGKKLDVANYDADHAFANPSQTRFHETSAKDAWKKTLDFFAKHLGS